MIKTPWHLWLIGIVSLLWNAGGAFDYWATVTRFEPYMSQFTQEELNLFYGFPQWVFVFWAIATFGSLLGSILLLLRSQLAVIAFFASLVAMIITTAQNFGFSDMLNVIGNEMLIFATVIFVISVFLYLYARRMKRNGVLT